MKYVLMVVLSALAFLAISWFFLFAGRPMAVFSEETRRQVYETSVTATTACEAELLRLYGEAQKDEISAGRKRALELQAKNEYNRTRCNGVSFEIQQWMDAIQ